jgi:hypothetical protein
MYAGGHRDPNSRSGRVAASVRRPPQNVLIWLERSTHGLDPTGQIGPADRNSPLVKPGDIGGDRFANLDLA